MVFCLVTIAKLLTKIFFCSKTNSHLPWHATGRRSDFYLHPFSFKYYVSESNYIFFFSIGDFALEFGKMSTARGHFTKWEKNEKQKQVYWIEKYKLYVVIVRALFRKKIRSISWMSKTVVGLLCKSLGLASRNHAPASSCENLQLSFIWVDDIYYPSTTSCLTSTSNGRMDTLTDWQCKFYL